MKKLAVLLALMLVSAGLYAEKNPRTKVTLNSVGDTMMGTLYPSVMLPPEDGAAIFKFVKPYLKEGNPDLLMANLEGAMTEYKYTPKNTSSGRSFAFRMPPSYIQYLKDAGFNLVTTANNHASDFGYKGYSDTRKYLDEAGIKYCGDKGEVAQMTINGVKVAVVGFAWMDQFNNILNVSESMAFIRKVAASNDVVVIQVHGGSEGDRAIHVKDEMEYLYGAPRGNMLRFCRQAIDNGADLIIGHGPHLPRAMEIYKDRLIAYSLGNFATYKMFVTSGVRKYTLVLNAELDGEGKFIRGKIVPFIQYPEGDYRGIPKYDPDKNTIKYIRKMTQEDFPGSPITIDDDGVILKKE